MITWKNMDTLASYEQLKAVAPVKIQSAMAGEAGAERVKTYTAPMGAGLDFNMVHGLLTVLFWKLWPLLPRSSRWLKSLLPCTTVK